MTKDTSTLNGLYAPFGKVIEGMDVVHKIEEVEVVTREQNEEGQDKPVTPPVIKSMSVETFGIDYGIPETIDTFDAQEALNQYYNSMLNNQ